MVKQHSAHEIALEKLFGGGPKRMPEPKRVEMRRRVVGGAVRLEMREDEGTIQDGIGQAGTIVRGGKIYAEPEQAYSAYIVRGSSGNAGLYEENYRSEPLIMDAISSHTEVIVQGRVRLDMPEEVDDATRERLKGFVAFHGAAFAGIPGGWTRYLEEATQTVLKHGFAPHEVIWGGVGPSERLHVHALKFYEPSTVDSWCFSEDMSELVGASFRTSGEGPSTWFTPALGPSIEDTRLIVPALNKVGNNVEGVSPQRPALFYVRCKRLLLQLAAIAAEKFGVPVTTIRELAPTPGTQGASKSVIDRIFNTFKYATGRKPVVVTTPHNVDVQLTSPNGSMPSFDSLIQYCDTMIAMTFSVEGSLLGLQSSAGSFALGEVRERDALRSAPRYARAVLAPINDLIRALALREIPGLLEVPRFVWTPQEPPQDDAARFGMLQKAFGGSDIRGWPKQAQAEGLKILGLPPDTIEGEEPEGEIESETEAPEAQTLESVLGMTMGDGGCGEGCGSSFEMRELPPEMARLERTMDTYEKRLAEELGRVQREMRQAWRDEVRVADDPIAAADALRVRFRARAVETMRGHVDALASEVARQASSELGGEGSYSADALDIEMLVRARADEFVNRVAGQMTEAEIARRSGATSQTVPVLAASTLLAIAATITGLVVNRARADVFEAFAEATGVKLVATRTSVLDKSTCSECRKLDGITATVGTAKYRALSPPHKCLGGARCRCVWAAEIA